MIVSARPVPGCAFFADSFTDLTSVKVASIGWAPDQQHLQVEFVTDLSDSERAAVWLRLTSADLDDETFRTAIAAFDPTGADLAAIAAQVDALTKLALGQND